MHVDIIAKAIHAGDIVPCTTNDNVPAFILKDTGENLARFKHKVEFLFWVVFCQIPSKMISLPLFYMRMGEQIYRHPINRYEPHILSWLELLADSSVLVFFLFDEENKHRYTREFPNTFQETRSQVIRWAHSLPEWTKQEFQFALREFERGATRKELWDCGMNIVNNPDATM